MIRKARVNDVVHSFVFFCKHEKWPAVIFEGDFIPACQRYRKVPMGPFAFVAYTLSRDHITAHRAMCLLATWLYYFTDEEHTYAIHILNTYYDTPRIGHTEQDQLQRHDGQAVPGAAPLCERH